MKKNRHKILNFICPSGKKTFLINMAGDVVYKWDLPGNPGGYAREGVF